MDPINVPRANRYLLARTLRVRIPNETVLPYTAHSGYEKSILSTENTILFDKSSVISTGCASPTQSVPQLKVDGEVLRLIYLLAKCKLKQAVSFS